MSEQKATWKGWVCRNRVIVAPPVEAKKAGSALVMGTGRGDNLQHAEVLIGTDQAPAGGTILARPGCFSVGNQAILDGVMVFILTETMIEAYCRPTSA